MGDSWFKAKRTKATEELMKDRNACMLLLLIAHRARRTNEFNIHNLEPGEALIGDYKACGLTTRQEYREAVKRLVNWKFITIRATNKGTIARIINSSIFDINVEANNQQNNHRTTIKQPSNNHPATTNKNVKNDKNEKREALPPSKDSQGKQKQESQERQRHGEYVLLYPGEHLALTEKFGAERLASLIEDVNNYCGRSGKTYKSYKAAILTFAKKDREKNGSSQSEAKDDTEARKVKARREYKSYADQGYLSNEQLASFKAKLCKRHDIEDFEI